MWAWELLRSPMGVPIAASVLALVLLVGGVLGHALGLWDLNDPPSRDVGPPVAAPAVDRAPAPQLEAAPELVHVRAERLNREEGAA